MLPCHLLKEIMMDVGVGNNSYTVKDIIALPEGQRAELIDGRWYDMSAPSFGHQMIVSILTRKLGDYIEENGGDCVVLPAPFAVYLQDDDRNYLEPDVSVICDRDKISDRGLEGAPDIVIEVVSPSTKERDYSDKMVKYIRSGVKEYWIIDEADKTIVIYFFEGNDPNSDISAHIQPIDEPIVSKVYPGFSLRLTDYL